MDMTISVPGTVVGTVIGWAIVNWWLRRQERKELEAVAETDGRWGVQTVTRRSTLENEWYAARVFWLVGHVGFGFSLLLQVILKWLLG